MVGASGEPGWRCHPLSLLSSSSPPPPPPRGKRRGSDKVPLSKVTLLPELDTMSGILCKLREAGVGFLTVNMVLAVYRYHRDPWAASFALQAYAALLILFWCLRSLERTDPHRHQTKREKLRLAVLILAGTLNFFSYQVPKLWPPVLKAFVWFLAGSLTSGGICVFCFLPTNYLILRYGPFWICTTIIFVAAAIGTFVTYLAHKWHEKEWDYDRKLVAWSAGLFYGYVAIVPLCLCIILRYFSIPSGLVTV